MEAVAAMAAIVAVHARVATRPKWSRELPEPFADTGLNGKPRVLVDETFIEKFDRHGMFYEPTRDHPEPGAITFTQPVPCRSIRAGLYREGAYCPLVFRPRRASLRSGRNIPPGGWGLRSLRPSLRASLARSRS